MLNGEILHTMRKKGLKHPVYITEPYEYDRLGAITLANLMFSQGQIVTHVNLQETSRQLSTWYIDKAEPADGFGQCEALTLIVSELNRNMKLREKKKPVDGYRRVKPKRTASAFSERKDRGSWQAR